MNQLTTIQPQTLPAFTMSDMERVALAIAKGGLFGSTDPNAVLTLCMLAQAEGQHPAVVFRDYHIISGKPAKKAEAMQRDFLAAGGKIEWHKLTDDECEATFSHPLGGTATISWDKARVKQAQLGGNKMHEKYPRQMLRSRVISEGVRTVFPSATSGLYESGEVQDMAPERAEVPLTPQPQRARDLKPAKAEQAQIEHKPAAAAPEDENRATWEKWVADYKTRVANAASLEDVEKIHRKADAGAAEVKDLYPDLYAEQLQGFRPADAPEAADAFGGGQ